VEMIKQGAGRQFDPRVVKVLEGLVHGKAQERLGPEETVESVHLLV